jgi:hypothetical protein
MLAEIVSTPSEVFELEANTASGERFQNLPSSRHNFLANTITRHGSDPIRLHVSAPG